MNGSSKHCSNCEEGNVADWFCDNCADWLCLQCKNAHARVRITKDHPVTQKNATQTRQMRGENINEKLVCHVSSHLRFNFDFNFVLDSQRRFSEKFLSRLSKINLVSAAFIFSSRTNLFFVMILF